MPLIQAKQTGPRRLAFDDHGYIAKMFAESWRDAAERTLHELIEFIFREHAYVHQFTPLYHIGCEFAYMEEKAFYKESKTTKPATLNCPFCRTADTYELNWLVRKKLDRIPGGADERDRAKFAKWMSYMVLLDDKAMCKNMRCRKRFDVSGIKTTAFI